MDEYHWSVTCTDSRSELNLLSVRLICQAGAIGSFNSKQMRLVYGRKPIVTATQSNGLYLVTHIYTAAKEMAFPSTIL
ncbi:hypothetical protein BJ878DRAFT_249780 [Calycina marina]|uniref:Uncharacterized protein n=1 Tax=Calycina marina TaxID=1763456 RepID=A0A9P7YWR9_9HELO|nr:hypothetical protein BJ878DRAFT_249780 [Calycina marina]